MTLDIRDNRDILKYRGLYSPSQEIIDKQKNDASSARLRLGNLRGDLKVTYIDSKESARETPFMRLLPSVEQDSIYDFYFPFAPQNISYSELSDEIVEIPRAGTTPIVAFKSHRLMRVSFEFLVAVPFDGILIDIEDSLRILRTFSTSSHRSVQFFHFDSILMSGWKYRRGTSNVAPYFNIVELSITARQRNSLGKITQAIVNVTLIENQNPQIAVVRIPPFKKKTAIKNKKDEKKKTKAEKIPNMSSAIDAAAKET